MQLKTFQIKCVRPFLLCCHKAQEDRLLHAAPVKTRKHFYILYESISYTYCKRTTFQSLNISMIIVKVYLRSLNACLTRKTRRTLKCFWNKLHLILKTYNHHLKHLLKTDWFEILWLIEMRFYDQMVWKRLIGLGCCDSYIGLLQYWFGVISRFKKMINILTGGPEKPIQPLSPLFAGGPTGPWNTQN